MRVPTTATRAACRRRPGACRSSRRPADASPTARHRSEADRSSVSVSTRGRVGTSAWHGPGLAGSVRGVLVGVEASVSRLGTALEPCALPARELICDEVDGSLGLHHRGALERLQFERNVLGFARVDVLIDFGDSQSATLEPDLWRQLVHDGNLLGVYETIAPQKQLALCRNTCHKCTGGAPIFCLRSPYRTSRDARTTPGCAVPHAFVGLRTSSKPARCQFYSVFCQVAGTSCSWRRFADTRRCVA